MLSQDTGQGMRGRLVLLANPLSDRTQYLFVPKHHLLRREDRGFLRPQSLARDGAHLTELLLRPVQSVVKEGQLLVDLPLLHVRPGHVRTSHLITVHRPDCNTGRNANAVDDRFVRPPVVGVEVGLRRTHAHIDPCG